MSSNNEQDFQFWPHLGRQEHFIRSSLERFHHLETFLEMMLKLVRRIQRSEQSLYKSHNHANQVLAHHLTLPRQTNDPDTSPSSESKSMYLSAEWSTFFKLSADACNMRRNVLNLLITQGKPLVNDIYVTRQALERRAIRLFQCQKKWQRNVVADMKKHLVLLKELDQSQSSRPAFKMDPWLSEQLLCKRLEQARELESTTRERLKKIMEDATKQIIRINSNMKSFLRDIVRENATQYGALQSSLSTLLQSIQINTDHTLPRESTDLPPLSELNESEPMCHSDDEFSFPSNMKRIPILKKGYLLIRTKLSLRKWKKVLGVVTETGYLHVYPYPRIEKDALDPSIFIQSTPIASYSLSAPRINVCVASDKTLMSQFTLTVPRKEFKWFRLGKSDDAVDVISFRASDQDSLVSWVQTIQSKIQSYLSPEAPSPIFTSEETLRIKMRESTTTTVSDTSIN